jgi:hypothetical protein
LRAAYVLARTPDERRGVALQAITRGLLKEGTTVAAVDQMFGTFCDRDRPQGKAGVCEIGFLPYHEMPEPKSNRVHHTWYLDVLYDARGSVVCYSLSNLHVKD